MLIEARTLLNQMRAYLCKGTISEAAIVLKQIIELPLPQQLPNYTFESITIIDNALLILYEANGLKQKPSSAYRIDFDLTSVTPVNITPIDYRITDATQSQRTSFWAINSFWIGDKRKLQVKRDSNFGQIIELTETNQTIHPTGRSVKVNEGSFL